MDYPHRSFMSHPMAKWGMFVIALFIIWFAGWFGIAKFSNDKIGDVLTRLDDRGISIDCANREIVGFPFRLGVSCDRISLNDDVHAYTIQSGSIRSAAQIYSPRKNIIEISSPFKFQNPNLSLTSQWDLMRLFVDARTNGFNQLSANWNSMRTQTSDAVIDTDNGALHLRPNPETIADLDFAGNANGLVINSEEKLKANISFDTRLQKAYSTIVESRKRPVDWLKAGNGITINSLFISLPDGGKLALSGLVTVQENGMLNGKVNFGMEDVDALARFATAINPEFGPIILGLGQGLNMIGTQTQFGDRSLKAVPVKIKNGWTRIGFIKLGRLPPLF